jgi:hypothetical protein
MPVVNTAVHMKSTTSPQAPNGVLGVLRFMASTVGIAATDDDGSTYRVFQDVPLDHIIRTLEYSNTAITGGTDYRLGIAFPNGGAVINPALFMGATSMATAGTNVSGRPAVPVANRHKTLRELMLASGDAPTIAAANNVATQVVDLILTATTVGTVAGTISYGYETAY